MFIFIKELLDAPTSDCTRARGRIAGHCTTRVLVCGRAIGPLASEEQVGQQLLRQKSKGEGPLWRRLREVRDRDGNGVQAKRCRNWSKWLRVIGLDRFPNHRPLGAAHMPTPSRLLTFGNHR